MYRMLEKLNLAAIRHPFLCLGFWLVVLAAGGAGLGQLKIDASYRAFFAEQDPLMAGLDSMLSRYTTGDTSAFMIAVPEGDVFTRETLAAIEELTEAAWQLPSTVRVDSMSNFPFSRSRGDELHVSELVENAAFLSNSELAQIRSDAMGEPLLMKRLISADASAAMIVVTATPEVGESLELCQAIYHAALELRDRMQEKYPKLGFHVIGVVPGNAAFTDVATRDGELLIPLGILSALLALFIYLWYASGRLRTAGGSLLAAQGVIAVAVMLPMGLMGWLGIAANNVTSVIPVVILTLAVADSLHILVTYYQRLRAGDEKTPALRTSLRINAEPVWLTSATTMMGFMALNFSESPPFNQMGNLVAVGVFTAWLASNTLLPAIATLMPATVSTVSTRRSDPMPRLAKQVIRFHRWILATGLIALIAGAACIPLNRYNDAWSSYLTRDTAFGADTAVMLEKFEDFNEIEFELPSGSPGGIYEPAYLDQVAALADWLRAQPEVRFVQSIDLTLKRLSKNMHGDDPAYYRMPQTDAEAAQYLLLFEMSLPYGHTLNSDIDIDKSATRMVVGLNNSDTAFHLEMQRRIQDWMKANAPGLYHPGTGTPTIMANLSYRDSRGMMLGTALALLVITLTLTLVFRSPTYGLLSMLVNAMPATIALGIWGATVSSVGLSVSMVFAASLGIIVDYCVHFISKYRRAKDEKRLTTEQAIEYAFSTVGVALLVTTAVLVINFGILGLSQFRLNIYMGVLTALTILLALLSQLFFLPALLLLASKWPGGREPQDAGQLAEERSIS